MNLCAVNGKECEALEGVKTWGQVLDILERETGPERSVVTAVRFRGVDQPSFRELGLSDQSLEGAAPIEVDTCGAAALVAETVANALAHFPPLAAATQQAADAFRDHDIDDASGRLVHIVVTLQTLTELTAAVTQASIRPTSERSKAQGAALLARLGQTFEALIAAAEDADWISVADILEYDISRLMPGWQALLCDLAVTEQ